MKNLILLLLVAPGICASAKDNFHLKGHIKNQLADSVKISYSLPAIVYKPIVYKAKLDNGDFSLAFSIPEGYTNLRISNGKEETEIYAEPDADLVLTVDAANFDSTLHYEGKGSDIANYLAKCVREKHNTRSVDNHAQLLGFKEPEEYKAALKKLIEDEDKYIDKNAKSLPETFTGYIRKANQYEVWYTMHMYPFRHESIRQKSMSVKDIPAELYDITDSIPAMFDDKLLPMGSYRAYLNNFFSSRLSGENARKKIKMETDEWQDSVFARVYREMPPLTAEFLVGHHIYNSLSHTRMGQVEHEFAAYKAHFPQSKNLAILREAIEQRRLTTPGKPEIDFDITTPDGAKMKLSALKGKVVYIDFWSRGCVPCIGEMKNAQIVRDHFKGKAVAFVYVSIDEDEAIWKGAVKAFTADGINTHLEKGREADVVKKYEAESIPCHYLIDKEGRFANVDHVISPFASDELIAQIEKLLQ